MNHKRQSDQRGMVAIIVTMIMIFVITLIVLGFSEVTRRNQREALDSQLGTQAYYAAETGVNDVVSRLNDTTKAALLTNTDCSNGEVKPRDLKPDHTVAGTCLTVDTTPTSLSTDAISTADSVVWHVNNGSGNAFSAFKFAWGQDHFSSTDTCPASQGTYPAADADSWKCTHALLRVDIIKTSDVASNLNSASGLASKTSTLYLQPWKDSPATTLSIPSLGSPAAYQGSCKPSLGTCTIPLNVGVLNSSDYYIRITSMYLTAKNVVLTGTDAVTSKAASFSGGQVVVDSTGRAQDQLKRIRVRIPLTPSTSLLPIYAVQGTDTICKNLTVSAVSSFYDKGECADPSIWP